MFVVNIALAFLVLRGDPEVLGYTPSGAQETNPATNPNHQAISDTGGKDLDLPAAMRTISFWFFLVAMFICGGGDFLVSTHLIPLVTDFGVSPGDAGQMQAWYGLMSLVGILIAGPASDLIGNKIPIALTFLLRVFLFVLVLHYTSATSFFIFALAFGFTHLITAPLTPTLIGKMYGLSNVGMIGGFITTIHHLAGGLLAYMGGWIFDVAGSYRFVFMLSAGMAAVAFFSSVLIRERSHRVSNG
jgi:predicted MFS family arabinose efflux permease